MVLICRGEVKQLGLCLRPSPPRVHPQISSVNMMVRSDQGSEKELAHFSDKQEEALLKTLFFTLVAMLCADHETTLHIDPAGHGTEYECNTFPSSLTRSWDVRGQPCPVQVSSVTSTPARASQSKVPDAHTHPPASMAEERLARGKTPPEKPTHPKLCLPHVITRNTFQEN